MSRLATTLAVTCLVGCGDTSTEAPGDTTAEATGDTSTEAPVDTTAETSPPGLAVRVPVPAPVDPLADHDVTSCPVYLDERCHDGARERCDIYDVAAVAFTDSPDDLVRRAYLFDRWYDRYHAPDGQTVVRVFTGATPPGTAEATWGALDHFAGFEALGDSTIWTGAALNAAVLRYATTGTEADQQRMETKARALLASFDATGIPGYLSRFRYLIVPEGTPPRDDVILRRFGAANDHPIPAAALAKLAPIYATGVPGPDGDRVGEPTWGGKPSIDQYSGPMVAFTTAFALLRDEDLKARITEHLTCYLKRLRRLDVVHLQDNPDVLGAVGALFGAASVAPEPGGFDPRDLDTAVLYYLEQPNRSNRDTFAPACPDDLPTVASRVIDVAEPGYAVQALELFADLQKDHRPNGIDHVYAPNVSGPHAFTLAYLAALAYYLTDDPKYRDFLVDHLLGELRAIDVAMTSGAVVLPPWCRSYFGDHIAYTPLWAFILLLEDGPLRDRLRAVVEQEYWAKRMRHLNNVQFNLIFAATVPPRPDSERDAALAVARDYLARLGGNGGILDDPRRPYARSYDEIVAALPDHIDPICPTEAQATACAEGYEVFGIPVAGQPITFDCSGSHTECVLANDVCAGRLATEGLPPDLRPYEGYLWQGSGLPLGGSAAVEGGEQAAGLDVSEPYWLARHHRLVDDGAGQVLAWRRLGACEGPP